MEKLQIALADVSDAEQWDSVVRQCPNGTVYHLFAWREIYQKVAEPYYFTAKEQGEVVGVLPLVKVEEKGIRKLLSLPQGVGGFCISERVNDKVMVANKLIQAVRDLSEMKDCHQIQVKADDSQADFYIDWKRIRFAIGYSVHVKDSWEALWKNIFNKKARKNVNHAKKAGCVTKFFFRQEITDDVLREFYDMHKEVCDRHRQEVINFEIFRGIRTHLRDKCYLCVTYYHDLPVAVRFFLADPEMETSFMYMGASKSDYWQYKPNDLGYAETIRWSAENNYKKVDLGFSPYPSETSGHAHFKSRWGGEEYKVDLFQYDLKPFALIIKRVLRKINALRKSAIPGLFL